MKGFFVLHVRREDIPLKHKWYPLRLPWVSQKHIADQFLQSANGAGTQLSAICRMRVARVPSYASMCVMYIHMQAPALTSGNVPLCNVLSCCPYVLKRSWPHNCDDVIHFVNQFFRACLEMGSWFKPICHRDFPSALWGLEDAPE